MAVAQDQNDADQAARTNLQDLHAEEMNRLTSENEHLQEQLAKTDDRSANDIAELHVININLEDRNKELEDAVLKQKENDVHENEELGTACVQDSSVRTKLESVRQCFRELLKDGSVSQDFFDNIMQLTYTVDYVLSQRDAAHEELHQANKDLMKLDVELSEEQEKNEGFKFLVGSLVPTTAPALSRFMTVLSDQLSLTTTLVDNYGVVLEASSKDSYTHTSHPSSFCRISRCRFVLSLFFFCRSVSPEQITIQHSALQSYAVEVSKSIVWYNSLLNDTVNLLKEHRPCKRIKLERR